MFRGYWQMPEKTAEELREDGFFITGDLGQLDADGYVSIVGRNKDLIISGGYNIYPKEIELLLDDQPGVLESAVIGVPHPDFGETVVGILVPAPGAAPDLDAIDAQMQGIARPLQASAQTGDPARTAAQHHGQGAEKRAARSVRRSVHRGLKPRVSGHALSPVPLSAAPYLHHLGEDRESNLLGGERMDVESGGRLHPRQILCGDAL